MAKYYGMIGYAENTETKPGVWVAQIVERPYYGDMTRNTRKLENSGNLNDNLNISNELSIIADPYAYENFHLMRYVTFMGVKWKVTSIEVQFPRLILTIGGVWND